MPRGMKLTVRVVGVCVAAACLLAMQPARSQAEDDEHLKVLRDPGATYRQRARAADGVFSFEGPEDPSALVVFLADDSESVRRKIARGLSELKNPPIDALLKTLAHTNENARIWAAWTLAELKEKRAAAPIVGLLTDESADVREAAAKDVKKLGPLATDALAKIARDAQSPIRQTAITLLGKAGDKRAATTLADLLGDDSESLRRAAAEALTKVAHAGVAEKVLAALKGDDPFVQGRMARILGELGEKRAVEPLVKLLTGPKRDLQAPAAEALGKIGDKRAVLPLIAAAKSWKRRPKATAIEALGRLGDPQAAEVVLAALNSSYAMTQAAAAWALGSVGDKQAVEPLIPMLTSRHRDVRRAAAKSLGLLGDPRAAQPLADALRYGVPGASEALVKIGKPAIEPTAALLTEPNFFAAQIRAAATLARLKDERGLKTLAEAVASMQGKLPIEAIEGLAALKNKRTTDLLLRAASNQKVRMSARTAAIRALGQRPDGDVVLGLLRIEQNRSSITDAVSEALEAIGPKAKPVLLAALDDSDTKVRRAAITALGQLRVKKALAPLAKGLTDPDVRSWAQGALDEFGVEAVPAVIGLLGHEDKQASWAAEEILVRSGAAAVEPTLKLLKSDSPKVRGAAADVLGKLGDRRAVKPLLGMLRETGYWARLSVVEALGKLKDPRAVAPIIPLLRDKDDSVRTVSADALGLLGDKRAIRPLIAILTDDWVNARQAAAKSLGLLGAKQAAPALEKLLNDSEDRVRMAAVVALEKIGAAPTDTAGAARVAVAAKDWDKAVKLGAASVEPLINALGSSFPLKGADAALVKIGVPAVKPVIRAQAARRSHLPHYQIIGRIGKPAIAPLKELLTDADPKVRRISADELRGLDWKPQTDQEKIDYLLAWQDWDSLAKLGKPAYPTMVKLLGSKEPAIRRAVADGLGEMGDLRAVAPLAALLRDPVDDVRQSAAHSLGRLSYKPATPVEEAWYLAGLGEWERVAKLGAAARPVLMAGLTDEWLGSRAICIRMLGEAKDKAAVPALVKMLKEVQQGRDVREAIVDALGKIADPRAFAPLLAAMGRDDDVFVRHSYINAFKAMGKPATKALAEALKHKDIRTRLAAGEMLALRGDSRPKQMLIDLLTRRDVALRAAKALTRLKYDPEGDSDWVHYQLAYGDRRELSRKPEVVKKVLLADLIVGQDPAEIENAVVGLLSFLDEKAIPELVKHLQTDGGKAAAEVYLKTAHAKLVEAARKWASANGYRVTANGELTPSAPSKGDDKK